MGAKISVLIMSASACLYAAHFIFVYKYILLSYEERLIYQFVISFIFLLVGLMTLLIILNVKIIYAVEAMHRRRTDMGVNNRDNVTLMKLYITFVRPILEYASVIWSPMFNINRLERVQRYFTNKIPGCTFLPYSVCLFKLLLHSYYLL